MLENEGKRRRGIRDRDRPQGVATAGTKAETQCVAERTYRGCHPIHSQSYPECHGTTIRTKRRYNDPQSALANRKTTRTPNNFTGGTNPRSQDRLHVSLSRLGRAIFTGQLPPGCRAPRGGSRLMPDRVEIGSVRSKSTRYRLSCSNAAKGDRTVRAERRRPSERLAALPTRRCDVRVPPLFLPFHSERREKGAYTTSCIPFSYVLVCEEHQKRP